MRKGPWRHRPGSYGKAGSAGAGPVGGACTVVPGFQTPAQRPAPSMLTCADLSSAPVLLCLSSAEAPYGWVGAGVDHGQ